MSSPLNNACARMHKHGHYLGKTCRQQHQPVNFRIGETLQTVETGLKNVMKSASGVPAG